MKAQVRRMVGLAMIMTLLATLFSMPAQPVAAIASWPVLRNGDNGPNVTSMQYMLRHRGYTLTVDGAFGPGTETVVKSFQSANGLTADGIVGANTWSKLVMNVDYGNNGNHVRALQTQLNKFGYGLSVDGAYGAGTQTAVLDFKNKNYLGGGSTVGATTWQHLLGSGASSNYALPLAKSTLPRSEYDDPHHDYPSIDLPTWTGTPTYAMAAGTVTHIGGGCGYGIQITASDGSRFKYCHLNSRSVGNGATVTAGQLIGYTGNTGNSTGPHLHLEVWGNGVIRCPQQMLLALYDGTTVPHPTSLPTSGCSY